MSELIEKGYKYINYLSLDVAVGAMLLSASISKFINDTVVWNVAISLSLSVWIIYTFDHLIDARKSNINPSIARHAFHKLHEKKLILVMVFLAFVGLWLVLKLPPLTIWYGLFLLGVVLGYFLLIYFFKRFYLKEVLVALVYTTGVFLGPVSILTSSISFEVFNLFFQLLLLALLNLTLFSFIEYDLDAKDNHASLARKIGKGRTAILIKTMLIALASWQFLSLIIFEPTLFQIMFLLMTMILFILYVFKNPLLKNDRYRWLGDAIFLIPAIELLV